MTVAEQVLESTEQFEKQLPRLLVSELAGRWVIFHKGEVQGDYDNIDEALGDAISRFGATAGFAVLHVSAREATPISAAYLFE